MCRARRSSPPAVSDMGEQVLKFRRSSERSVVRSVVLTLLATLLVPIVTVLTPTAPASAAACDTVTSFTAADSNSCWTKPYLTDGVTTIVSANTKSESPDQVDLVGDSTKPVYEYFSQGAGGNFFFKIRVRGNPTSGADEWQTGIWSIGAGSGSQAFGWVTLDSGGSEATGLFVDTNTTASSTPSKSHTYSRLRSNTGNAYAAQDGSYWAIYLKVPTADLPVSMRSGAIAVAAGSATGAPWNKD